MLLTLAASLLLTPALTSTDYTAISSPTIAASANAASTGASISSDGNLVAFRTESTNLVTGATNPSIIVYNRSAGTFRRCSSGLTTLSRPSISRDGRYVAFYGAPASTSINPYVFDLNSMSTTPVSAGITSSEFSADGSTFPPTVSDSVSGTYYCTFRDLQNVIIPGKPPTTLYKQAKVWTLGGSTIVAVSNTSTGAAANQVCDTPVISADGSKVAFISTATNLQSNTAGIQQVFLATKSGSTWTVSEAISKDSSGTLFTNACSFPTMSSNGDIVAFQSQSGASHIDVWVRKRTANTTFIPYDTTTSYVTGGNQQTQEPNISPNGLVITYRSFHLLETTHATSLLDTYAIGTVGYVGDSIYVQNVDSQTPNWVETYHLDGTTRRLRGGYIPCLSNDGSVLAFDSGQDRILNDTSYPSVGEIYVRTGASW